MIGLTLLLALAWVALVGDFSLDAFVEGFIVSFAVLALTQYSLDKRPSYLRRFFALSKFLATFLWDVVKAGVRMAITVLSPQLNIRPAVVQIPLTVKRDSQITLLANMITLTPGTLSLDLSADHQYLYVHTIDMEDVETFRREIKEGFERRVIEVTE